MPALPTNAQALPAVSGSGGAAASPPTLSVSGRADGEAYTVTAGARSITITAQAGATLQTTVEQASDGATVSVTDSTTATPDWTAPSGGATGEAVQVRVTATLSGLSSSVAWTERVAGAGGSGGWTEKAAYNLKGATTSGPHTSGTTTVDATGGNIDMTAKRAGNSGTVQITQNTGAVITAIGGSGAMTAAFDLSAALAGYNLQYVRFYAVAVDVFITAINFDDDGSICNVSLSDSTTWNDGDSRGLEVYRSDASNETRRVRGANGTTVVGTERTQVTERVVTLVMTRGQIVDMADTSGTTAPSDPHTATLFTCGGDAVGRNNDTPLYLTLYLNVTAFGAAALTVTDIKVRRFE